MARSSDVNGSDEAPAWTARKLIRAAREAALATQSDGQPFAGLVTPATTADASLLLLLSDLSEHTRHLRADPRCAVLLIGKPAEANPQTAPRVTVLGEAAIDAAPELRARFLAVHPYASLYIGFGDFNIWRIRPRSAAFVGGFARAFRFSADELGPDPAVAHSLHAAAPDIIAHCNVDHAETMALLADAPAAHMVGVDVDGCDLLAGESVRRIAWSKPVASPDGVRAELIRLARSARRAIPDAAPGP